MADLRTTIRRQLKAANRTFREFMMVVKGVLSTDHPVQVHIIPMRRCNLSCAYCNEYDDVSQPVPLERCSGASTNSPSLAPRSSPSAAARPLLHPELDDIIGRIRQHGMIAGLITNGFRSPGAIERLNRRRARSSADLHRQR